MVDAIAKAACAEPLEMQLAMFEVRACPIDRSALQKYIMPLVVSLVDLMTDRFRQLALLSWSWRPGACACVSFAWDFVALFLVSIALLPAKPAPIDLDATPEHVAR